MFGGKGITRIDGCVTFVPFTAPGDVAQITIQQKKKNYQEGEIKKLEVPSPYRTPPRCPHFTSCGGCQFQHISYEQQLRIKQGFVQEALQVPYVPISPSPKQWNYRTHIRLNLRKKEQGFEMGFIGTDNRSIIKPRVCPLFLEDPIFFSALSKELLALPNEGISSASLRIFKGSEKPLLAFSTYPHLPKKLPLFSFASGVAYKSPRKEHHRGKTTLSYSLCGLTVPFSPYGFMQNNLPLSEAIYNTLLARIGETPKKILDLYSGVGIPMALLEKKGHQVIGVEANKNLPSLPSSKIYRSRVEAILPKLLQTFKPDIILVNPPKVGLSKEVRLLLDSNIIYYLSCMPPTLARDLNDLKKRYHLDHVEAFDLFPQTTHVETLLRIKKISSQS